MDNKPKLKEIIMPVKGMHCKSCEKLIESRLSALNGINTTKVSFAEEMAYISFDADIINLNTLKSEIEKLGYKCACDDAPASPESWSGDGDLKNGNQKNNDQAGSLKVEPCKNNQVVDSRVGADAGRRNPVEINKGDDDKGDGEEDNDRDYLSVDLGKLAFWRKQTKSANPPPSQNSQKTKNTFWTGLAYGLIPHIGCIAFVIGSIFGVTVLMKFFKPLLMSPYFFHVLLLVSLFFATLSSVLYLRKNSILSLAGIKRKWKYIMTMYGSTIGINIILFLVVFPLLANITPATVASASVTGSVVGLDARSGIGAAGADIGSFIKLKVSIPCPGHAPLISGELRSVAGVTDVKFGFPNLFSVKYDPSKATKEGILSLKVFETYKASVVEESEGPIAANGRLNAAPSLAPSAPSTDQPATSGGGGCGCGGGGGGCGALT